MLQSTETNHTNFNKLKTNTSVGWFLKVLASGEILCHSHSAQNKITSIKKWVQSNYWQQLSPGWCQTQDIKVTDSWFCPSRQDPNSWKTRRSPDHEGHTGSPSVTEKKKPEQKTYFSVHMMYVIAAFNSIQFSAFIVTAQCMLISSIC